MSRKITYLTTALLLLITASLSFSGCLIKEHEDEVKHEGMWLRTTDNHDVAYRVQLSRQLNPADSEDKAFLVGLTSEQVHLAPDELLYAVFLNVRNAGDKDVRRVSDQDIKIVDTQDKAYMPVSVDPEQDKPSGWLINEFGYHNGMTAGNSDYPDADSVAGTSPVHGVALVYKLKVSSLENRPLHLVLKFADGKEGEITLDT